MEQRHYHHILIANTVVPAAGWLLSLPGLAALLLRSHAAGGDWLVISCVIYGVSLMIAYAAFTLYHLFKYHPRWGRHFRILDHATIYLLIAGTYTPFTLVYLRGHWGWTLFATLWVLTVLGIFFKIFFIHRFKVLGPLLYLGMGWLLVVVAKPAMTLIPVGGLWLILAGGLFYSFGLIFYAWQRLRFHHAIWHLFVLAGSLCHYFAIYWYVIPPRGV